MKIFNKQQLAKSFNHAATTYDAAAVLQREIGQRSMERLDIIKIKPETILDLGSGTGHFTHLLKKRYSNASVIALDIAENMLQVAKKKSPWWRKPKYICGDAERLPFLDQSFDLIFSNLYLQWCDDLPTLFAELFRVLKPNGLLLFTTFGPDTLLELRHSWSTVDSKVHVHSFADMHEVGDELLQACFSDPVMDMEMLQMTYSNAYLIMKDLKSLGAHNMNVERSKGLTSKNQLQKLIEAYETFRDSDGQLTASYEVVYGHAWKPTHSFTSNNEFKISIDQIKRIRSNDNDSK